MLAGVREFREITDAGVTIVAADGCTLTIEADTVVAAFPQRPNTVLAEALKGASPRVLIAGPSDASKPWMIVDAIAHGHRAGCAI